MLLQEATEEVIKADVAILICIELQEKLTKFLRKSQKTIYSDAHSFTQDHAHTGKDLSNTYVPDQNNYPTFDSYSENRHHKNKLLKKL